MLSREFCESFKNIFTRLKTSFLHNNFERLVLYLQNMILITENLILISQCSFSRYKSYVKFGISFLLILQNLFTSVVKES